MSEKLVNFRFDEEKYFKLKELALRERVEIKTLLGSLIDDYLKVHADGNPNYVITDFVDVNFMCCPAFYRDREAWENYISKSNNEERQKIKQQILLLDKTLIKYF